MNKYIIIALITLLLFLLNKEKFVMDINGNIPDNLFLEKRIPSNDIPTIDITFPANRIYNPIPSNSK